MAKWKIIFLCLVISLASSLLTTVVVHYYFEPERKVPEAASMAPFMPLALPPVSSAPLPQPQNTRTLTATEVCQGDIGKLCSQNTDIPETQCLQDHFDEVSLSCHKALQSMRDSLTPCKDEIARFCARTGYGGNRMVNCLNQNREHLSPACLHLLGIKS